MDVVEPGFVLHVNASDLFKKGHTANRWFSGIARELEMNTKAAVTALGLVRTGRLLYGISSTSASAEGLGMSFQWMSRAPYTRYVLRATHWPIRTHLGQAEGVGEGRSWIMVQGRYGQMRQSVPGFWMHFGGFGYPTVFRDEVAGYAGQNFLLRGWQMTRLRHPRSMAVIPYWVSNPR